jgi:DNA-binding LacI/PurR family transcriptional regulator
MKDIACRVGVSIKSVSRVLNGEPGVSPATAQRITDVARELGFRRNDLARNLRQGTRSGVVGLALKHSATRFFGSSSAGSRKWRRLGDSCPERCPGRRRAAEISDGITG